MAESSSPNIQVTVTQAGTYTGRLIVTANGLSTEKAVEVVVKPEIPPPPPPEAPRVYPPDESFSVVTPLPITFSQLPYLVPVEDKSFGRTDGTKHWIMRVSDGAAWGKPTSDVMTHYSKTSPWNCDQTLCIVDGRLLDCTNGYKIIRTVTGAHTNFQWDNEDPNIFWNVGANKIYSKNARLDTTVTSVTIPNMLNATKGDSEGCMDLNCTKMPLYGTIGGVAVAGYYNLTTNTLVTKPQNFFTGAGGLKDNITVLQSGTGLVHRNRTPGTGSYQNALYDLDLNFVRNLGQGSHEDVGYNQAGEEVLVQHINMGWKRISDFVFDPANPQKCTVDQNRSSYNGQFNNGQGMGGHCNARNIFRPGWYYNSNSMDKTHRELFGIKANNAIGAAMTVERFGFARMDASQSVNDYRNEAKGTVSPWGDIMIASTQWPGATYSYAYIFYCTKD